MKIGLYQFLARNFTELAKNFRANNRAKETSLRKKETNMAVLIPDVDLSLESKT